MAETRYQLPPEEPDDDRGGAKMGFLEHLDELRTRIIRSCMAIGAGMLVAFFFVDRLGDFILAPTLKTLPAGDALIYTSRAKGSRSTWTSRSSAASRSRRPSSCIRSGASSRRACTRRRRRSLLPGS